MAFCVSIQGHWCQEMEKRMRNLSSVHVHARRSLRLMLACGLALGLAGCGNRLGQFTGSLRDVAGSTAASGDPLSHYARQYDARPGDKAVSIAYAERLRASGQYAQAVAVLHRASAQNVGDREIYAAYGKALVDIGQFQEAMQELSQAHAPDRPDPRVLSTQGSILDQMGDHARAREYYMQALKITPNDPVILSNLGLSYVLTRNLAEAEDVLQRAAALPDADARIHANLALVISLKSRQAEAPRPPLPQKSARPEPQNPGKTPPRKAAQVDSNPALRE